MARVRFIGPEPVTVPELGSRTVNPDEVVEVPDERYDGYVCQTTNWKAIDEPGAPAQDAAATQKKSTTKREG